MKKILASVVTLGVIGVLVAGSTTALFNDEEVSLGNTFTAGAVDLLVDSEAHYDGMVCRDQDTDPDDEITDYQWVEEITGSSSRPELIGEPCNGSWTLTDLGPENRFFEYTDVKPGDHGENTISLHVVDNDAWVCAIIDNMVSTENDCTEPESDPLMGGDLTCGDPGIGEGELQDDLMFFAWDDDGDNVWEDGEMPLFSNGIGPAADILGGTTYPLFTPATVPMDGGTTEYIGLYWCLGTVIVDAGANTLTCDGSTAGNITQTDGLSADFTFYVEQSRNNPNFVCPDLVPTTGTLTLEKLVDNSNGTGIMTAADFTFSVVGNGYDQAGHGHGDVIELLAGDYTVTELPVPDGYTVDYSQCGVDGLVTVSVGQISTCTITNTDVPAATAPFSIDKQVTINTPGISIDPADFVFNIVGPGVDIDYVEGDPSPVLPLGTYSITETYVGVEPFQFTTLYVSPCTQTVPDSPVGEIVLDTADVPVQCQVFNSEVGAND